MHNTDIAPIEQDETDIEKSFKVIPEHENGNEKGIATDYAAMSEGKGRQIKERHDRNKKKPQPTGDAKLPIIKIVPGKLHEQVNAAEQVLLNNNPGIYQRAGQIVRIVTESTKPKKTSNKEAIKRASDSLVITEVDPIYLSEVLGKAAAWWKFDMRIGSDVQKDCPAIISRTLIARREWGLPVLSGIIQAPTLRPDGSILETPGYDAETGLFFDPGQTTFPPILQYPSLEDAIIARDLLCKLYSGFPFENKESKSVAISTNLTGLIRKSIRTAPLHAFSAPKMGSGKSLLATASSLIITGQTPCMLPQAIDEAEEQKRLLAVLMEGDPIICYDNIERAFGSAALCTVLTEEKFKGRILGSTRNLSVPTNSLFMATGNNLTFFGDTSTRAILCRLDPQCERPEEREFEIDLYRYIPEHRGKLVQAALTILRAYHIAGRPKQDIKQFGRFEEWSDFVRSALVWVGMEDPCASRKEIENADPVRLALGTLLAQWHAVFDNVAVKANAVVKKSEDNPELREALLEIAADSKGAINERVLGKKLATFKGRIENGYRLESHGESQHAVLWRVKKV